MRYLFSLTLAIFTIVTQAYGAVAPAESLNVEIYTIPSCPGCEIAKSKLQARGITPTEISLYGRRDLYRAMKERVYAALPAIERRPMDESMTVPKIFINGKYVPYSDLDDQLDRMITIKQQNPGQSDDTDGSMDVDQTRSKQRKAEG